MREREWVPHFVNGGCQNLLQLMREREWGPHFVNGGCQNHTMVKETT